MPESVPRLLFRGMSGAEYGRSKARGYFESAHQPDLAQTEEIELGKRELEFGEIVDPEEREHREEVIEMWEAEMQARDLAGEFDLTFWADTYANAAGYGPVVVTIRTRGIEGQFMPFEGRLGEWVTDEPVPFSAMHGAKFQLHRTQFEMQRPEMRHVRRHVRRRR